MRIESGPVADHRQQERAYRHAMCRRPLRTRSAWLVVAVCLLAALAAQAETTTNDRLSLPPSHLHADPFEPIYMTGFLAAGMTSDYDSGRIGYGGTFLFRPGAADRFLNALHAARLSFVLQGDYQQLAADRRALSADGILRRYLQDMTDPETSQSAFFGAGLGATDITLGAGGGHDRYMSWLLEVGQEWILQNRRLLQFKLQYRGYRHAGWNYSYVSVQLVAGVPLPW